MLVLGDQEAVDKMKRNEPTFTVDGSIILGKGSAIRNTLEEGVHTIPFSLADGLLVDLSIKGEVREEGVLCVGMCAFVYVCVHVGACARLPQRQH